MARGRLAMMMMMRVGWFLAAADEMQGFGGIAGW